MFVLTKLPHTSGAINAICRRSLSKDAVALCNVLSENKQRVISELTGRNEKLRQRSRSSVSKKETVSAVLVPLCSIGGEPAMLFTRRATNLKSHRGEISFPGGLMDIKDGGDVTKTAVRETCEELGVKESLIDVWGEFALPKELPARGRMLATPVIAHLGEFEKLKMNPSPQEVDKIHIVTLGHLCDVSNHRYTVFKAWRPNPMFEMYYGPAFHHPDCYIYGLTAVILCATLPVIYPQFKHRTQLIKHKTAFSFF
ncbi:mitochondrial coenzyme A diphosphatase NUDT8-like isoform X2 [Convolutriloba macropyga]|uniref:mitochondrial coenzyme A diphosphatase NUDT8-like isoform X2 n=1 Tax=Convolutriloba macropyga TaxID=536237 RepID=UPI003F51F61B